MNAWITRLLAGAACTAGALALGTTAAQADSHHHGIDLDLGVVKVSTHHEHKSSSSHHSSSSSSHHSSSSGSGLKVRLNTPVKARVDLSLPSHHSSSSHSSGSHSSGSNGTSSQSRASSSRTSYVQVQAHVKALELEHAHEAEKAQRVEKAKVAAKALKVKAAQVKAAKVKAAKRQQALDVRAHASLLKGLVPATRVLAGGRVLDLPVRVCALVNTDGCDRTTPAADPSSGTGTGTGSGSGSTGNDTSSLITAVVKATADVPVVGQVNACALVNASGCTTHGTGSTSTGDAGSGSTNGGSTTDPDALVTAIVTATAGLPVVGNVNACALVNASGCTTTGSGGTTVVDPVVTAVVTATADLPVVGDVNACALVNATGCTTTTGGPTDGGTPALPVLLPPVVVQVGTDVPVVGTVDACVLINASGCATGTPGDPGTPGTPGTGDGDGNGNGNGGNVGDTVYLTGPYGADAPSGGTGNDSQLAQTGAPAGLAGLLGLGLLLLLAGTGLTLRRNRR